MVKHYRSNWSKEINDIVRGASGGFLFGIPLLYTMEVWEIGSYTKPPLMLAVFGFTYVVVFLFNRIEGFKRHKRHTLLSAALESIEALAIGIVCSAFTLILLQIITLDTDFQEALGKIIFETVPFAIGASLARLLLSGDYNAPAPAKPKAQRFRKNKISLSDTLSDLTGTFIGAIIISFNIAPTDEVTKLAAAASPPWLLAIIAASLLISYTIVFGAGFANQHKRQQQRGLFQTAESETLFSYLNSLLTAVLTLWFFQKVGLNDPWFLWLRYTLILGLPATIGGAAGRLAV